MGAEREANCWCEDTRESAAVIRFPFVEQVVSLAKISVLCGTAVLRPLSGSVQVERTLGELFAGCQ